MNTGKMLAMLLMSVSLAHAGDTLTASFPGSTRSLAAGVFLVATETMPDPHFYHAVILIVAYGKEGALGLIVNQPDSVSSRHSFPGLPLQPGKGKPFYYGGPLGRNQISMLIKTHCRPPETGCILDDVYYTAQYKVIKVLLQKSCGDEHCRTYAGFASWSSGQLEQELLTGGWLVAAADPDSIFGDNLNGLWERLFEINHGIWARDQAGSAVAGIGGD